VRVRAAFLALVLASSTAGCRQANPTTPQGWQRITYRGLQFAAPGSWPVRHRTVDEVPCQDSADPYAVVVVNGLGGRSDVACPLPGPSYKQIRAQRYEDAQFQHIVLRNPRSRRINGIPATTSDHHFGRLIFVRSRGIFISITTTDPRFADKIERTIRRAHR
jgi:hypothetical protein